ncbi:MAG: serine/threonine protein kinase [Gemmataceae bacterium]|nr:serine/threonine protein kinase [Gemmataceae bacterium]
MDSTTLITHLRDLGLWPEDEAVERRLLELEKRHPSGRDLARELLQLNLLTPYQANQILTGKGPLLAVGPYRILERLGEGGMGQVFKARHTRLHRVVALKLIRPERVTHPVTVGRFHREVESAAKLSHPNLVRAYDAGEADGTYYFAMQYVPGTDLARLVKERGPLPVPLACDFIAQAACGLHHIHAHGLVHRDVKPGNLMVAVGTLAGSDGTPPDAAKILDLGVARLNEDPDEGNPRRLALTQLGVVMGTADYMAPEQARDSRSADARSDVYSLGCTFYFALTGQPPFPGGTALEKLLRHQLDEPAPVGSSRPDVPPAVAEVLRRLMAKRPEDRYQTAAEVADALAPFRGSAPASWLAAVAPLSPPITPIPVLAVVAQATGGTPPEPEPLLLILDTNALPGRTPASPWMWVAAVATVTSVLLLLLLFVRFVIM